MSRSNGSMTVETLTLSVDEAAKAIGIGRDLAYDMIHSGELRSIKVGRRRLVPKSAVVDFVERRSSVD